MPISRVDLVHVNFDFVSEPSIFGGDSVSAGFVAADIVISATSDERRLCWTMAVKVTFMGMHLGHKEERRSIAVIYGRRRQ